MEISKENKRNTFFINSSFTDQLTNVWMNHLLEYDKDLEKLDYIDPQIYTLYIHSPGGSVYSGLQCFEYVKYLQKKYKIEIITKCFSCAMSMGAAAFMLGDKRLMSKNSVIMFHESSSEIKGTTTEMRESLIQNEILNNIMVNYDSNKMNISKEEYLKKINKTDWYVHSDEALKLNIATEIIT